MNDKTDIKTLIEKIYGSLAAFSREMGINYNYLYRVVNNPHKDRYADIVKRVSARLLHDSQTIKYIDDNREAIMGNILVKYRSLTRFAEKYDVNYASLWRYATGRCYNMNDELRSAFIKAGFINAT